MDKKNTMLLTVIAVATLLVAVVGATFAYFTVSNSTGAGTTQVTGSVGGDHIGSITLLGGSPLFLAVSANDMAETKKGTDYFTVLDEDLNRTDEEGAKGVSTYTATLSDTEDSTAKYSCNYKFNVVSSGTMLAANVASRKDVELVVNITDNADPSKTNETVYNLTNLPGTIEGTWTGITGNGATRVLSAYMVLHNTEDTAGQNDLAGTGMSVTLSVDTFTCYPES